MNKYYEGKLEAWKGSSYRKTLADLLEKSQPKDGWRISDAICLGTGDFSKLICDTDEHDPVDMRARSVTQLAAFLDIVTQIQPSDQESVPVLAQDPTYTPIDMQFLAALGVKPVPFVKDYSDDDVDSEDPDAMNDVTATSFVCEFNIEQSTCYMQRLLDVRPQVILGSMRASIEEVEKAKDFHVSSVSKHFSNMTCDGEQRGLERSIKNVTDHFELNERLLQHYKGVALPYAEEDRYTEDVVGGLCLLVRREDAA